MTSPLYAIVRADAHQYTGQRRKPSTKTARYTLGAVLQTKSGALRVSLCQDGSFDIRMLDSTIQSPTQLGDNGILLVHGNVNVGERYAQANTMPDHERDILTKKSDANSEA